jgi:hypothetical protein
MTLEVYLPPLEENTLQRLHLEATGKVIRVDAGEECRGFAATAPFTLREKVGKASTFSPPRIRMEAYYAN